MLLMRLYSIIAHIGVFHLFNQYTTVQPVWFHLQWEEKPVDITIVIKYQLSLYTVYQIVSLAFDVHVT